MASYGVGIDLPWGERKGFDPELDGPSRHVARYLEKNSHEWGHFFFAFQPKYRSMPELPHYQRAFDQLFSMLPDNVTRGLYHTMLNLATGEPYPREKLLRFTNDLVKRYGLAWVVEDLGYWSLNGKSLPYPLPPVLNAQGLERAVANIRKIQEKLDTVLSVEFPGFTDGHSLIFGEMHAFDFFREVAELSETMVTLDTGHLLGYWHEVTGGFDGIGEEITKLPLERCLEIHTSGAAIRGGRFFDTHDGMILSEQISLLGLLRDRCPNLKYVTYEDPAWDHEGNLLSRARPRVTALRRMA